MHIELRKYQPQFVGTYVLMLITAAVMVLLIVPGMGWKEPTINPANAQPTTTIVNTEFRHGWPCQYLRRWEGEDLSLVMGTFIPTHELPTWYSLPSGPAPGMGRWSHPHYLYNDDFPWLSRDAWRFSLKHNEFQPWKLLADVVIAAGIVLLAGVAYESWRKRRARLLQFRLLEFAAAIAVIAIGCGYFAYHQRLDDMEWATLNETVPGAWNRETNYVGPEWLAKLVGIDHLKSLQHCTALKIYQARKLSKAGMHEFVLRFPLLESITIEDSDINPEVIDAIAQLPHLSTVTISGDTVGSKRDYVEPPLAEARNENEMQAQAAAISRLATIPNLTSLSIYGVDALQNLSPMPSIKSLTLDERNEMLTPAEMQRLTGVQLFPNLEELDLNIVGAIEKPAQLARLTKLKSLDVSAEIDQPLIDAISELTQLEMLTLNFYNGKRPKVSLDNLTKLQSLKYLCIRFIPMNLTERQSLQAALPNAILVFVRAE